ncbi:MAG TPA: acyltransferase family protein [Microthrixaceae bacterium]|nr:acyltransferase family protein [Microthrixaceae bacterium]
MDGLRAISVIAVILYHANISWLPGGFLGVEVFFVVSGFLITSLLLEERFHTGRIDLRQFWIRRARRLLPALYLLLAVVSLLALLFYKDAAGRLGGDVLAALAYVSNWWNIFLNESYFAQAGRPPVLRHLWSLAVEEQFYLIFPPLFIFAIRRFSHQAVRIGLAITALASSIAMAVMYEPYADPSRVYYGTDTRLAGMLVGALLALGWAPWRSARKAADGAGVALDIVGALSVLGLVWFLTRVNEFDPFIYRGGFLLLDLVCIVLIAVLVHPAARISGVFTWKPLVWVGLRSYAIYLWHWPIFQFTRPELDIPISGLPLLMLRLGLTLGAAEVSYRLVEQPFRKGLLGNWWRSFRRSEGELRAVLMRQGTLFGGGAVVLVLLLGAGLADASSSSDRQALEVAALSAPTVNGRKDVPGSGGNAVGPTTEVKDSSKERPEGDKPNSGNAEGKPSTSGGVATTAKPGTSGTPGTAPATTAKPVAGSDVVAVGDSVMLGASGALHAALPGMRVDAKVGRQFDTMLDVIAWYVKEGYVPGPLVVHVGTNGVFGDDDMDRLFKVVGDRKVLLINAKVSRPWQDLVNDRLAAAARAHPNAVLIDWHGLSSQHPEWFANDGAHLLPVGAAAYAELIRSNL